MNMYLNMILSMLLCGKKEESFYPCFVKEKQFLCSFEPAKFRNTQYKKYLSTFFIVISLGIEVSWIYSNLGLPGVIEKIILIFLFRAFVIISIPNTYNWSSLSV